MSTILVVDDERDIRDNLEVRLRAEQFDVVPAANGADAVQRIKEGLPDVVLLDVMMPGMDGFETCRAIKKEVTPRFIPVLMLTALNHADEKVRGLKAGADDFISKPFNDKELVARVNAFLRIKSLHDQLDASYRELQRLEGLKDNLIELIVHDLKSPVVSSTASLSLFRTKHAESAGTPAVADLLAKIQKNNAIQLDLIDDILQISKMEHHTVELDKKNIPAAGFIDDITAQVASTADTKGIRLEKSVQEDLPDLYGDPEYLRRILVNLLHNSLKYTPRGGKVSTSASFDAEKGVFTLTVSDTGLGIPEKHVDEIFDRFFQVDPNAGVSRRGAGLGLSFCRMAAEAHGGSIRAESTEGKGSRFYVTIPGPAHG